MNKNINNDYAFYSRMLNQPFESLEELRHAEAAYLAKQRAKEDKAAAKKADAQKVEDAFKALNRARKSFKDDLNALTDSHRKELQQLRTSFDERRAQIYANLSEAEAVYSAALKEFTDKYPEGFHLTLKDGDFESTISHNKTSNTANTTNEMSKLSDLIDMLFRV